MTAKLVKVSAINAARVRRERGEPDLRNLGVGDLRYCRDRCRVRVDEGGEGH